MDRDEESGRELIAQYLLLYEMSGGSELSETVDYNYQRANVEIDVKSNSSHIYARVLKVVDEAERGDLHRRGDGGPHRAAA